MVICYDNCTYLCGFYFYLLASLTVWVKYPTKLCFYTINFNNPIIYKTIIYFCCCRFSIYFYFICTEKKDLGDDEEKEKDAAPVREEDEDN